MIGYAIASAILAIITFTTGFLPVVTELPFGMDSALTLMVGTIHSLLTIMPWLSIVWTLIIFALSIKVLLFIWHWIRWLIELVRG